MVTTEVTGICQSAIIIRSAIIVGLKELRDTPTLIQDALASLPQDDLTAGRYGERTIQQCTDWFVNTNVPVKLGLVLSQLTSPVISVELSGGDESDVTIGDVDYNRSEPNPHQPGHARQLASVHAKESCNVILFVQGEPELLLFLDTLVRFSILRHKEDLFDDRGITRLGWSCGGFGAMNEVPGREQFFARTIRLNYSVRHCWPVPAAKDQPTTYIESVPFGPLAATPVSNDTATATSAPVTPTNPTAGGDPFSPANWENRDIISGEVVTEAPSTTPTAGLDYVLDFTV